MCLKCSKLSKCIAIIYKQSNCWTRDSLYVPYLSYCSALSGNTYKTNIYCFYILQKKVLRIVCNVSQIYHSNALFKELCMLKLFDIVELRHL